MTKFSFLPAILAGAGVAIVANTLPASAVEFSFTRVPDFNNVINPASNFKVNVAEVGGQVKFTFTNSGPATATITDIYFGKSTTFSNYLLNNQVTIQNGTGVSYTPGAAPPNPGGGINWNAAFSSDPQNSGFGKDGIDSNLGESVSFLFNYAGGSTFNDVLNGFTNGQLTIALHAQSIGGDKGGSDWFTNNPNITTQDIPEPFTILGTGAALGFSALFQRERNKRKAQAKA